MKAVKIYQAGGPEQLIYQDVPTPDIKESWSLVKIKGFGINHSEIFTRKGKSPSVQFPRILGICRPSDAFRIKQWSELVSWILIKRRSSEILQTAFYI